MSLSVMVADLERLRLAATARRANSRMFAEDDELERMVLPVEAARESARRGMAFVRPLSGGERGAFLVEFEWLREELAK